MRGWVAAFPALSEDFDEVLIVLAILNEYVNPDGNLDITRRKTYLLVELQAKGISPDIPRPT